MSDEKNIAILGSTGSIGRNTIEVVNQLSGFRVFGISGHSRIDLLLEQARQLQPALVVPTSQSAPEKFQKRAIPGITVEFGSAGIQKLVSDPLVDVVVTAIVGRAGLESTWTAVEHGKRIALANKEALVLAGQQICDMSLSTGAQILPVDSEHSAIFQCLDSGKKTEVEKVILTASGGPFLNFSQEQMQYVTVEQALAHPTWNMGKKITIDSATMMNKALEVIEARWLFDLKPDQIAVVVHPQSIIHSMVEYRDGSVIAQMSPPDMKLPIQYALTYPDRLSGCSPRMDFSKTHRLEIRQADFDQFPALALGFEVAEKGGTTGAVLNAANEAAVDAFLNRKISFTDIVAACREILDNHHFDPNPNLESLIEIDLWAREEINKWIAC